MILQNVNIHKNCLCYQKGDKQLITLKEYTPNETGQSFLTSHLIVFILDGTVKYSIPESREVTLHAGSFIFFPSTTLITWEVLDKTTVLMFRIGGMVGKLPECHTFRFQRFKENTPPPADPASLSPAYREGSLYPLVMNERLAYFIEGVKLTERDGLKCSNYAQFLIGQMLTLIQVYYPREEYIRFYSAIASPNVAFADHVYENWLNCRSAGELANALNMTLPQLRLNFLKVFHEAPGAWLQNRRKEYIYYDICSSHKSASQIASEHDFSLSNFNRYCRMNYGHTAAEIREGLTA